IRADMNDTMMPALLTPTRCPTSPSKSPLTYHYKHRHLAVESFLLLGDSRSRC
ncbi:hypothetical protein L195_g061535, partial [Trifolium pratense]